MAKSNGLGELRSVSRKVPRIAWDWGDQTIGIKMQRLPLRLPRTCSHPPAERPSFAACCSGQGRAQFERTRLDGQTLHRSLPPSCPSEASTSPAESFLQRLARKKKGRIPNSRSGSFCHAHFSRRCDSFRVRKRLLSRRRRVLPRTT